MESAWRGTSNTFRASVTPGHSRGWSVIVEEERASALEGEARIRAVD
jgi:hypothetical protein